MIKKIKNLLKKLNRQQKRIRRKIENYEEAIVFAEAGLLNEKEAKDIVETKNLKILVVGKEHLFSEKLQSYAIEFANRMDFGIVALNVGPLEKQSDTLKPFCDILCKEFVSKCEESVKEFKNKVLEKNIEFEHIIKFGDVDDCIKEVYHYTEDIDFVIEESEVCDNEENSTMLVFCISH